MNLSDCYHCGEQYPKLRFNQNYCCTEHQVKAKNVRFIARRAGLTLQAAGLSFDRQEAATLNMRGWLMNLPRHRSVDRVGTGMGISVDEKV